MFRSIARFFTENAALKLTALILALVLWFYAVNELNKGSEEDKQFLSRVLPSEGVVAKKLAIRPIFIGGPLYGYVVDNDKAVITPEYCIVVGPRGMLEKMRYAHTMPIDLHGVSRSFTKSVPLSPIAPGIFMEETLVQVTIPIERSNR